VSLAPDLKQRVLAAAAAKPAPTRGQTTRARLVLFVAAIAGALTIFFIKGGVRMTNRPPLLVALTSVGTAILSGVGMYLLFTRRGRSMLRRPGLWLLLAALGSTVAFVSWKFGVSAAFGMAQSWPGRGTDPLTPAATGAAFGAGAGLGSALLVDLWCPVAYVPHLLLGHVLPIGVLAALGALVGWRLLRVRSR